MCSRVLPSFPNPVKVSLLCMYEQEDGGGGGDGRKKRVSKPRKTKQKDPRREGRGGGQYTRMHKICDFGGVGMGRGVTSTHPGEKSLNNFRFESLGKFMSC